jgi:rfaE bifunctional protein nucleotidyltransferase chain/domain
LGCVVSLAELKALLATKRASGEVVVTTNGCFDLLHVGHLRYLQQARALGDCLVVALNSDASVRAIKGELRPIVPQEERAELLAALTCVDYVVLFEEPSPEALLVAMAPTVHTKGAQYTEVSLPEADALKKAGSSLAFITMVEGRSTSSLVEKIIKAYAPT